MCIDIALPVCCCCFSLKTGSYVIGCLNLLTSSTAFGYYLYQRHPTAPPDCGIIIPLAFWIILSVILIIGVITRNFVIISIYLCGGVINFITIFWLILHQLGAITPPLDGWYFIAAIFLISLWGHMNLYCWVKVYQYYRKLQNFPYEELDSVLSVESSTASTSS